MVTSTTAGSSEGRHDGALLEALYLALFEHGVDGVLLTRPDGTILRANPAACRAYGLSEAEVCRLPGRAQRVVDDAALRAFLAERDRAGLAKGELTALRADGTPFPIEVTSAVILTRDGGQYAYVIFRDITERRLADEARQRSERQLSLALEGSNDGFCSIDLTAPLFAFSERVFEIVGEPPQEPMASPRFWWERVHPDDIPGVRAAIEAHLRGGTERIDVEYRLRHVSGRWTWVRALGMAVERDGDGRPTRLAGTLRDLTERREARERLRAALAENEQLVAELREALQNVKTLSGLLPMCAWCHKIRNDSGYWQKIEAYVSQRSDARFTHGMCPDCYEKHHAGDDG